MKLDELRDTGDRRLASIRTLSRRLRLALRALIGLLVLAAAAVIVSLVLGLEMVKPMVEVAGTRIPVEDLTGRDVAVLILLVCPGAFLVGAILYQYERLLALYEDGVILAAENAMRIRRAGQLMVVLGVLGPVLGVLAGIFAALFGSTHATLELGTEVSLLLAGVANIVIGHVMSIACDISADADLTI